MRHKISILLIVTFLGACESNPSRSDAAREEVITRHGRIIDRAEVVDPTYDRHRQQEAETKSSRESVAKVGFLFGAMGGVIGEAIAPQSDATEYPSRYRYLVKFDAAQTQEVIDTCPYPVGDCVRVATGRNTGKLSLISGYKGECDSIP